jgi:hypothetical protein
MLGRVSVRCCCHIVYNDYPCDRKGFVVAEAGNPWDKTVLGSFVDTITKVRQPVAGANWMLCEANVSEPTVVSSGASVNKICISGR